MFGRQRDGSLTEEGFITATIVVIISERKEISGFTRFFFEQQRQQSRSRKWAGFLLLTSSLLPRPETPNGIFGK